MLCLLLVLIISITLPLISTTYISYSPTTQMITLLATSQHYRFTLLPTSLSYSSVPICFPNLASSYCVTSILLSNRSFCSGPPLVTIPGTHALDGAFLFSTPFLLPSSKVSWKNSLPSSFHVELPNVRFFPFPAVNSGFNVLTLVTSSFFSLHAFSNCCVHTC